MIPGGVQQSGLKARGLLGIICQSQTDAGGVFRLIQQPRLKAPLPICNGIDHAGVNSPDILVSSLAQVQPQPIYLRRLAKKLRRRPDCRLKRRPLPGNSATGKNQDN